MTTTATAFLDRLPVDEIRDRAKATRPRVTLVRLVTGIFWLAGFVAAKVCATAWLCLTYSLDAAKTGWVEAHGLSKRAQINALEAQVAWLAAELERQR